MRLHCMLALLSALSSAASFAIINTRPSAVSSRRTVSNVSTARTIRPADMQMVLLPHLPQPFLESAALNSGAFAVFIASGKASKMLTNQGAAHAYGLGTLLWYTLGWRGWTTCVLYLLAGSAVTKVRMKQKTEAGIAEARGGRRGPENVWGSAAAGALCAVGTLVWPQYTPQFKLGFVASLATKLSDTVASEIGKAYGKTTYLITTLKKVPPGTEGAVSLEGTAAGVVGSLVMALYGHSIGLISKPAVGVCALAAFVATNIESLLGATTQGKTPWLTNEVINFINTVIGAAVAVGVSALLA